MLVKIFCCRHPILCLTACTEIGVHYTCLTSENHLEIFRFCKHTARVEVELLIAELGFRWISTTHLRRNSHTPKSFRILGKTRFKMSLRPPLTFSSQTAHTLLSVRLQRDTSFSAPSPRNPVIGVKKNRLWNIIISRRLLWAESTPLQISLCSVESTINSTLSKLFLPKWFLSGAQYDRFCEFIWNYWRIFSPELCW